MGCRLRDSCKPASSPATGIEDPRCSNRARRHAVSPLRRLDAVKVVEEVEHGAAYHETGGGVRVDVVPAEQFHAIGVHLRDHIEVVGPESGGHGPTRLYR